MRFVTGNVAMKYQLPDFSKKSFAQTNSQTIFQRALLLKELLSTPVSIAELCCGDCSQQFQTYSKELNLERYCGLDIDPRVKKLNAANGIECVQGDVLDKKMLQLFTNFDVVFFGPPLSVNCDGHQLFSFSEVVPSYGDFAKLFLGGLNYQGTLICICPRTTTIGDITQLHNQIRAYRKDIGLRLIHHSHSTMTGSGEETELRLKYKELWFSIYPENAWEIRESKPG